MMDHIRAIPQCLLCEAILKDLSFAMDIERQNRWGIGAFAYALQWHCSLEWLLE